MKKFLLVALAFHAIFFSAQKKDNCTDIMKRWDGWDIYKKPTTESVKKCISKDERKIKIEVINKGDYIMNLITKIIAILVGLEFLYIMYIETIITTSEKTSKVFGIPTDILQDKTVSTLLKNQGIYNGLIGVLILIAVLVFASKVATISLLIYVILVATYGGITSNPKIILMQGGLAILALISTIF